MVPVDMCPPLSENNCEAWGEEFDNQPNLKFPPFPNKNLGEPMKQLTICTN